MGAADGFPNTGRADDAAGPSDRRTRGARALVGLAILAVVALVVSAWNPWHLVVVGWWFRPLEGLLAIVALLMAATAIAPRRGIERAPELMLLGVLGGALGLIWWVAPLVAGDVVATASFPMHRSEVTLVVEERVGPLGRYDVVALEADRGLASRRVELDLVGGLTTSNSSIEIEPGLVIVTTCAGATWYAFDEADLTLVEADGDAGQDVDRSSTDLGYGDIRLPLEVDAGMCY